MRRWYLEAPFLRILINLTTGVTRPCHYIRITHEVKEDLKTWSIFLQAFNGKSLMFPQYWLQSPSTDLCTVASGTLGYGAVLGPQWLFGPWDDEWRISPLQLWSSTPLCWPVVSGQIVSAISHFVSFRQQGGGRYHQFPDIQRHKGHELDEKTSTLLSASQHPLPSSSHP